MESIGILNPNPGVPQASYNYVASHYYNFVINLITIRIHCQFGIIAFSSINSIISNGSGDSQHNSRYLRSSAYIKNRVSLKSYINIGL